MYYSDRRVIQAAGFMDDGSGVWNNSLYIFYFGTEKVTFKVKRCYSRFNFHVLDYCQWLRNRSDLSIPDCIINKWNYGVSHQLLATSGHSKSKQQSFSLISHEHILRIYFVTKQSNKNTYPVNLKGYATLILTPWIFKVFLL